MTYEFEKKNVVIVGGGFAGVRAALDLNHLLPLDWGILVIDSNRYHSPHPMLYEVATAVLPSERKIDFEHLEGTAAIPYHELFSGTRVRFRQGKALEVLFGEKRVLLTDGTRIPYNFLLLSVGSQTNYFSVPGLESRAFPMKSVTDALNVRNGLEELFSRKGQKEFISIVVGGGGYTGVELAGELPGFVRKLSEKYGRRVDDTSITVVEASPRILGAGSEWVTDRVVRRLISLGIKIKLGSAISSYDENEVTLADGSKVPADFLVWTAGIKSPDMSLKIDVPKEKGYLVTNDHLQLAGHDDVFAVGDMVYCFNPVKKCPVAATAQRAIQQAAAAASNIASHATGEPMKVFAPTDPLFVVPVGRKFAIADLGGIRFEGFSAWILKMIIEGKYLTSILPLGRALALWLGGIKIFVRND